MLSYPDAIKSTPQAKEIAVILMTGDKIVYPSQGPCLIGPLIERVIDEQPLMFYQLIVLDDCGGDLFVPVEKVASVGIRLLLNISEIPKLMEYLIQPAAMADSYRQRNLHNLKLFASGSAFDLAEIVGSLTELHNTRSLSFGEHKTLEKAKRLLVCEIAEVMATTRAAAMEQIEGVLAARTKKAQVGSAARRRMMASRDQSEYQAASG
jgi:RNA polymerase-interacting CarD/CdnL/TRCF family regulator